MLVAWDTLEIPTYRHEKFPAYQSGREFDNALLEQLNVLPEFVAACGFLVTVYYFACGIVGGNGFACKRENKNQQRETDYSFHNTSIAM